MTAHELAAGQPAACLRCRELDAEVRARMASEERADEVRRRMLIEDARRREEAKPRWVKIASPLVAVALVGFLLWAWLTTGKDDPISAVLHLLDGK